MGLRNAALRLLLAALVLLALWASTVRSEVWEAFLVVLSGR